ncbi:MAG: DNA internalization-related competence protein ComEC/Rec2 [Nitrospirae bacterium]|nr:DNA internalization-related competence protein ComEC/Rec2 [Nitrospirota bacterium]
MINFALSFISGIAAFQFFPFFPVSIIVLFIAVDISLFLSRRSDGKRPVIFICAALFGFVYSFIRQDVIPEIKIPDEELYIQGTIIDVPEMSGEKLRFTISEVVIEKQSIHGSIRLVVIPEVYGDDFDESLAGPGDRISAIARLRVPGTFRNPGVYAYDLKKEGIVATGYIKQMKIIAGGAGLLDGISKIRQKLGRTINKSLTAENAPFHNAMITGLTGGISREMRDAFGSTGLAHVLSISGTHFGLLAFIFFTITKSGMKRLPIKYLTRMTLYITPTRIAAGLTLPVLAVYAVLSGLSTPTIRSFIMVFIYMLALLLGRRGQWLNSLSIAATLILLWNPEALFELSFILSFAAVLSIGYVLEHRAKIAEDNPTQPPFKKGGASISSSDRPVSFFSREGIIEALKGIYGKIVTGLFMTIAAVLGTAPFVALYFKQFPLISPLTNLVVTPLICFVVLPLGLVSSFIALILNMPFMPLNGLIDTLTNFTLRLISSFTNIPYVNVHIHNPSFVIVAGYFVSLIFLVKSKRKWRAAPLALVIGIYLVSPYVKEDKLSVTFLDAGQGDSAVVELPGKKVMLIDGSTGDPDMGRMVIAPYLWSKGIRKVDYMVMSHPHPDHYGGLIYVADNMDVGEIWFNGMVSDGAEELFRRAGIKNIPYKILNRGAVLESEGYRIYVMHPYDEFYASSATEEYSTRNSDSLVLKIESDDASILFTGDIEQEAEDDILFLGSRLKSDIIKVPHHGGRTSSSEGFINAVAPQIAVISAGRGNSFGHPHKDTLDRYEKAGAKVFRTDMNGAVTISLSRNAYQVETYEDSVFKRVRAWRDEIRNLRLLF